MHLFARSLGQSSPTWVAPQITTATRTPFWGHRILPQKKSVGAEHEEVRLVLGLDSRRYDKQTQEDQALTRALVAWAF